ncbi:MAG TPA: methylmalonyl-CoA mutase family protein [Terriglobia bacterium]|nr:methylmalonyl-CoA mutase family protein [Terriglobia bacterium]
MAKDVSDRVGKGVERTGPFTTVSGVPIDRLYTPDQIRDLDYAKDLADPGQPPYTRGIYPTMYRGKQWTMRQFSGFGTAADTNERFHYLLKHGQDGLSVAFHLPTLMGLDSDDPMSEGEVGRCGVAIDSLADMETLFKGLPLDKISTSMTTNAPATILWSMYLVVAEKQGVDWKKLRGTIQNDILKEYIAQKTYIFPPRPSMKLIVDTFEFGSKHVPQWNTISISGYHIREAGSTALQELAFTLYDGIEYIEWARRSGLDVDEFAPRLSFFFNAHNDLFEEIAKYRAARKIWYKIMTERFHCKNPRSAILRFHTQTAGCSLTAQQPYNNIVRVAIQALAAVLGGTQSLHTNSLDETLALPTEHAARIALRTQQILAHESGITNTADPLGGSYFVERLTLDMEKGCWDYFERLDAMGGMVAAIEKGFPQREIHDAAYEYQKAIERKEKIIVGVNEFVMDEEPPIDILLIDESVPRRQVEQLRKLRETRDNERVRQTLEALREAAATHNVNMMPSILDCVRAYTTLGEICATLRSVYGVYEEPIF